MKFSGEIKVSSEEIIRQADEGDRLVNTMSGRFDEINRYMDATKGHWVGTGGDTHRKLYQSQMDDLADLLRRLREHPKDLREMAGIYVDAEKTNVAAAQMLPTEVIS